MQLSGEENLEKLFSSLLTRALIAFTMLPVYGAAEVTPPWVNQVVNTPFNPGNDDLDVAARGNPSTGGDIIAFKPFPSTDRVVYLGDRDNAEEYHFYAKDIFGGTETQISPAGYQPIVDTESDFAISDDEKWLVYQTYGPDGEHQNLYSSLLDGTGSANLLSPQGSDGQDIRFTFQIIGESVVIHAYVFESSELIQSYLCSTPIDGGSPVILDSAEYGTNRDRIQPNFIVRPEETPIVYHRTGLDEGLYSVPITGGQPTRLADSVVQDFGPPGWDTSLDGSWLVYTEKKTDERGASVYAVPTNGGAPIQLSPALVLGETTYLAAISPDGMSVVFGWNRALPNFASFEYFSVPIVGGGITQVSPSVRSLFSARGLVFTPDSQDVVMIFNPESFDGGYVYRNSASGGTPWKLWDELITEEIESFEINEEGSHVIVASIQFPSGYIAVHSVNLDGSGGRTLTNQTETGNLGKNRIISRGVRILCPDYRMDIGGYMLTNYHVEGGGADMTPDSVVTARPPDWYSFNGDGTVCLYIADQGDGGDRLYATYNEWSFLSENTAWVLY